MNPTPGSARKGAVDLERMLMSLLLGVMAAITFVEVTARYLFHAPLARIFHE